MKKYGMFIAFVLFFTGSLYGQVEITGQVKDIYDEPLPGVNVLVKGTTQGTITDLDGNYVLSDVPSDGVLVFSFVGMLTQEIPVGGQVQINVTLEEDVLGLDEVVVIGYGYVKKRDLTGSVASVKSDDIVITPTYNALEAIQGRVPGMDITRESGSAGSGVNIYIRGHRSIGDPEDEKTFKDLNEPLVIIDGIQGGSIEDINPNDIESIEVLKDASSTAIYGYQGSNGVILITTKRGAPGKTRVSYNTYFGINGFTSYPAARTGEDYIKLRKEAYRTSGLWIDTVHTRDDYNILFSNTQLEAIDSGRWVDWRDLLVENGIQQSHQLSVTSGTEKTQYYLSLGYFKEEGVIRKNDMTRYSARLNLDHIVSKWFRVGMNTQLTYSDQNRRKDPMSRAMTTLPLGEPYNEDGTIKTYPLGQGNEVSPLTDERLDAYVDNDINTDVLTHGYFEITPISGLSYRTNLGVNLNYGRRGIYKDEYTLDRISDGRPFTSVASDNTRYINFDNIITYTKDILDHSFTITALTSYTDSKFDDVYGQGFEQGNSSAIFYLLESTLDQSVTSSYEGSRTMSYAGRINYSYKGRYLFTATQRYDGASMVRKHWDDFPSVAVAWRVSDEPFMGNLNFLSNLKIRISRGVTGNSSIKPYSTQSLIEPFTTGFGDVQVIGYRFPNDGLIGNKSVGWEKSTSTDLGFDVGVFKNRISATIDIYHTKTKDLLLERALPESTGVSRVYQNIGKTENKGIELALNTLNINTRDFKWNMIVTYSRNREKITELVDNQNIINDIDNSLILDQPIKTFYTFQRNGIWQLGEEDLAEAYNSGSVSFEPGDIRLEDLNHDGIIDDKDRAAIGAAVPKWIGGLDNSFNYKSIELSVFLFARWGQMIDYEIMGRYNPSGTQNGPAYFDYWTPTNPSDDFPRPRRGEALNAYYGYQTLNYVDGSYFKIKNVSLGYTLPSEITRRVMVERFKVYATVTNILTVTKCHLVKYYDPERGGSEKAPLNKQIIFGVNVDF